MPGRVLIIKFGAIGDVVMAIPAAHELHRAGYAIDWVCGAQVLPLLERYSWIRPIVADDHALFHGSAWEKSAALLGVWRSIGRQRYAISATLYYDSRYRLVSLLVRADRKVMLSRSDRLRQLLPGRHHTDEYLRVMLGGDGGPVPIGLAPVAPGSLPSDPGHTTGRTTEHMTGRTIGRTTGGRPRVVLVPGGARNALRSDGLRRWPAESYAGVARALLALGVEITLVGGPEDLWAAEPFRGLDVINSIGALTILETVALIDASDILVTHDTGPLHLAGITSAGIVSIFGPTDPWGRLPQRPGTVALWGGEGFACRPCYDGSSYASCRDNLCVQQVTPEMVVREVSEMLAQRALGSTLPPRIVTPTSTVAGGPKG